MRCKEKEDVIQQERRRAHTVGGVNGKQMQGAKRKRMLIGTKNRLDYSEGKCTA